jgi:hypothetical protein
LTFDPVECCHGEVMHRLFSVLLNTSQRLVADAFVARLSTRRLDWHSALGSYAVFRHLPDHEPINEDERRCTVCGFYLRLCLHDANVLNFERFKWGGVRHTSPLYAMLDLELLSVSGSPQPTPADIQVFVTSSALSSTFLRYIERCIAGNPRNRVQVERE